MNFDMYIIEEQNINVYYLETAVLISRKYIKYKTKISGFLSFN